MLKRITQEELDRKIDAFAGGLGYDPDIELEELERGVRYTDPEDDPAYWRTDDDRETYTAYISTRTNQFAGLDLSGLSMREQDASLGEFGGSNLEGADLSYGHFYTASFDGANLAGVHAKHTDFVMARFVDANLEGADLAGSDLRDSDFRDAKVMNANMQNADLTDADLSGADLTGADLSGANLAGVIWKNSTFIGVKLDGAKNVSPGLRKYLELQKNGIEFDPYLSDLGTRIAMAQKVVAERNQHTTPGSKGPGEFVNPEGAGADR